MCGMIIASSIRHSENAIAAALGFMSYRGKDNEWNVERLGGWFLGHQRLAIQHLDDHQPFDSGKGRAMFVGEFFSDVEEQVTVQECLQDNRLFHEQDGFWSVGHVYEEGHYVNMNLAEVYTDHLGIKPLYWWKDQGIVCSEIEPMFQMAPRPPLDEIYLSNCIKFGYDYSGRTPWQGIVQLPPRTKVIMHPVEGVQFEQYYNLDPSLLDPNFTTLRETIFEAIRNRLMGEREVALLMSGGLDSSIIYYALQEMGIPVRTFTAPNGEDEFLPEGVEVLDVDEDEAYMGALNAMQAPLDLGSMIPQYELAKALQREGFHVVLSGDGADELFGGYRRAMEYDSQASDVFCELPYYHLPRLDRVMMRSTIELRSPFLAPKVVRQALALPHSSRRQKDFLKVAFRGIVPEKILERKKHPLKSHKVISGGTAYRAQLVEDFRTMNEERK